MSRTRSQSLLTLGPKTSRGKHHTAHRRKEIVGCMNLNQISRKCPADGMRTRLSRYSDPSTRYRIWAEPQLGDIRRTISGVYPPRCVSRNSRGGNFLLNTTRSIGAKYLPVSHTLFLIFGPHVRFPSPMKIPLLSPLSICMRGHAVSCRITVSRVLSMAVIGFHDFVLSV